MNDIAIVIPTLDAEQAIDTGALALLHAGVDAKLIVVSGPERGFTKTVNDGLRQTTTEDVCILNDDVTWFQPNWLAALQRALYSQPDYGIVGPSGKSAGASRYGKLGQEGVESVSHLSFWCVLLRRQMIDAIGHLDERYIHYASDTEYCIRAKRCGWQTAWVKAVWLEHEHHGSKIRKDWKQHDMREFKRAGLL